jgi:septal ring-binding cell division protein DamX
MTHRIATILGLALLAAGCGRGESPASDAPADAAGRAPATAQPAGGEAGGPAPTAGADTTGREEPGAADVAAGQPPAGGAAPASPSGAAGSGAARTGRGGDAGSPASLYTVQVAAFLSADSARIWSDRLGRAGLPVWTTTAEVAGRTFYRLRVGAHPDIAGARRLGDRIRRELRWPVWIAPVERQATIPEDVVARTRALVDAR